MKAQEDNARIEREIKAVEAKMESEFEDPLVIYNVNVLRNSNLN